MNNKKLPPKNTIFGMSPVAKSVVTVFSLISIALPVAVSAGNTSKAKLMVTGRVVERLAISETSNRTILTQDGTLQVSRSTSFIDRAACFKSNSCSKFYIQGPDSYHYSMISSDFDADESSDGFDRPCQSLTNQSQTHGVLNAQGKDLVSCAMEGVTEKNGQETVILIYD